MKKMLLALVFATSLHSAHAQPVGIGTSPQGTLTYQFGATLAKQITETHKLQARVQPSSGTGAMIPLVNSNEIDIGFCNTLELYEAYKGINTFDKRPQSKLRTLAVLFPLQTGLFVRADSNIKSIADLKGKRIAYGFTSQEIIKTSVDAMLATAGLTINDMQPVLVPNLIRGVEEFMAGRVDVATFAIGGAKVSEADVSVGGLRFLDFGDKPEAEAAMKKIFVTAYIGKVAPAANRAGVKETINTMFYDYTVFASSDMPASKARMFTALFAEKRDEMAQSSPIFGGIKTERLFNQIDVPFHDGAKEYFAEKGIKESK